MCFWQRPLNFSDTEFSWFGDLLHLLCTHLQRPQHPVSAAAEALISTPQEERHTIAATTSTSTATASSLEQAYAVNGDKFSTFPVSSILLQFFCYFLVNVLFFNKKITFDVDIYSFLMHSHSYSSHDSSIDVPSSLSIEKIWLFEWKPTFGKYCQEWDTQQHNRNPFYIVEDEWIKTMQIE